MTLKPALSIQQQINLLRHRGMTIVDEKQAFLFLQSNHYYRLNIYFHKLMDAPNHYSRNVHFSKVIALYKNDRWLRNKILSVLEPIEIHTRTIIAHYLALTYGPGAFYQAKIYKEEAKYQQIQDVFFNQITRNKKDPIIRHHQQKYNNVFPIWVVVEFFSFNTLSKFYKNLLEKDKKEIAKTFNQTNDYLLVQWLHVLSIQRNICAHYGYLFQRDYPIRPKIARSFHWDPKENNKLFAQILVMRRLSDRKLWNKFSHKIAEHEKAMKSFKLEDYGFPFDWRSYLL